MKLSVVIPLFNEEESLPPLVASLKAALVELGSDYEVLLVDDGSQDNTFEVARRLAVESPQFKVLSFRRNYGQTAAVAAGIDYASGEVILTMDGDLQNDASDIPLFLEKLSEGYDMVVGWRHLRQDKLISRKIPSRIANWMIGKVTGVPIKDNGCSLKAFRGDVIKSVPLYSEMHRFIPAMASIAAPKILEVKVKHHHRQFGESKYGLSRVYKVLLDLVAIKMVSAFTERPLRWFATLALPTAVISFISIWSALAQLFSGSGGQGIVFGGVGLLFATLFCFLILCGALGELVYKTGDIRVHEFSALTARYSPGIKI